MSQTEHTDFDSHAWEADPWDVAEAVAKAQSAGFCERAVKPIIWTPIRMAGFSAFGIESAKLIAADVEFIATHDGEDLLLMQLAWHGFPDPPEWRLSSRPCGSTGPWQTWGYFGALPKTWQLLSSDC